VVIDLNTHAIPEFALYFVRSKTPEEIRDANFSEHVTYGELNHNLADSLKNLTFHCFLPFLREMDKSKWGSCEESQYEEFMHQFRRFNNDVIESIKNSKTQIKLKINPELQTEIERNRNIIADMMSKDTSFLLEDSGKKHFEYITGFVKADKNKDAPDMLESIKTTVDGWLSTMRAVIDERQKQDEENDERCGLRNEMDFWKHRYYKLNSIDEQLNSVNNKLI